MLNYRCLVLDHDDTTVDSTRKVNYPQFREVLPILRPNLAMTEAEFIRYCYDPGFYGMCRDVLHYTDEELTLHIANWKEYLTTHHAPFFDGIPQIIARQKAEGGIVCVVSHSYEDTIRSLYDYYGVTQPDLIFGADYPDDKRKPSPYPLREIMRRCDLSPQELLMVDDMPHGYVMAKACGVRFACAAWYGMPPEIREKMLPQCDVFLPEVKDLERLLFSPAT